MFDAAFGDPHITPDRIGEALAVFERTIISRRSKFDEFLAGNKKALNNSELKGLHLFRTKARCMNCHNGPLFTDNMFHQNGIFHSNQLEKDKGRYIVTHDEKDIGKFKTPSLRDVNMTGPWMHDGSEKSLPDIMVIYNKGGLEKHDELVKPLSLTKWEIRDLIAFLKAISAPSVNFTKPVSPE